MEHTMARRIYTPEFRAAALARVKAGETAYAVAKNLGVPSGTFSTWTRAAAEGRHLMTPSEQGRAAGASRAARARVEHDAKVENLVFLITVGGEYHTDNLSARTGVPVTMISEYLREGGFAHLSAYLVYGDGSDRWSNRDNDYEFAERAYLPVAAARAAA